MEKITPEEYKAFAKYIQDISGIALEAGKEYLIETRLNPILEDLNCATFAELYHKARMDKSQSIEKRIIDAISTNETYFFRDVSPFEVLQHKIIPDLIDTRTNKLQTTDRQVHIRIWSAAASTGQEIYSIAMTLKELYLDPKKYRIHLLGTDISNAAITQASYGHYNKFEISRGLTPQRMQKYFNPDAEGWRIKDEIRAMVMFKKMNLMEPFVGLGRFDIIFCRNVAIYFSQVERRRLYEKLFSVLEPDGYLIIGSTESLTNETPRFKPQKYLRAVFYQPAMAERPPVNQSR